MFTDITLIFFFCQLVVMGCIKMDGIYRRVEPCPSASIQPNARVGTTSRDSFSSGGLWPEPLSF